MKKFRVACTNLLRCGWEGRRSEASLDKPCPWCGGINFWREECKTKEQRRKESLERFKVRSNIA